MKPIDDDFAKDFELSTGRKFYANMGIIGLTRDGDELTYGSDGGIDEDFTNAERVEIADYMIAQWQAYRRRFAP